MQTPLSRILFTFFTETCFKWVIILSIVICLKPGMREREAGTGKEERCFSTAHRIPPTFHLLCPDNY